MSFSTYNEFMAQEKERAERKEKQANGKTQNKPFVSYFALKNNGDTAIIRFPYKSAEGLGVYTTHPTTINGKFRRVNCLRKWGEPADSCPLCKAGNMPQRKTYVKLIEYVRNEDGTVTATPRIWERPAGFLPELNAFFTEYGDLSDLVFKVTRNGVARDPQTKYPLMPLPRDVYPESIYVKDFSALDEYDPMGKALLNLSFDEAVDVAKDNPGENVPAEQPKVVSNPYTTATNAAEVPTALTADNSVNQPQAPVAGGQKRVVY